MAEDRLILLTNRGDGVDEIPNDELIEEEDVEQSGSRNDSNQKHVPENEISPPSIMYVASCVAAIGGLLFGYDMGIISGAKTQMQKSLGLSCSNLEWVVSLLPVGGFVASITGGILVDRCGRRTTIILNAILFTIGAVIVALSKNLGSILLGRFVLGFAVSLSAIAECIYISEIAIPNRRGGLVSLNELGITVGILLSFLANYCLADIEGGWRVMFGISAVAAIVQAIAMFFLPKTPHFLMISKKEAEAEETIRRLGMSNNVRQTVADIRYSVMEDQGNQKGCIPCLAFCNDVVSESLITNQNTSFINDGHSSQHSSNSGTKPTSNMCRRLVIGLGLVFFQQFTGQPNMIYYAADIFRIVGFCGDLSATLATVGLGAMKVVATIICLSLIDRIGRRIALIFGISMMGICLLLLTFVSFYDLSIHPKLSDSNHQYSNEACRELANHESHGRIATRRAIADAIIRKNGIDHRSFSNSESLLLNTRNDSNPVEISFSQQTNEAFNSRKIESLRTNNKNISSWKSHSVKTRAHQILGLSTEIDTLQSSIVESCEQGATQVDTSTPAWLRYLATIGLVGYVCAYSFSFGPVTWVILSEIFPAATKGRAMAFTTSFNWLGNFIVSATFLQATHTFTIGGVFLFYAVMCILALIFSIVLVPETKDKTLEEISKQLNSRNFRVLIGENTLRKGMVYGSGSHDDYTQSRNQYSRIPSNSLQTEM